MILVDIHYYMIELFKIMDNTMNISAEDKKCIKKPNK